MNTTIISIAAYLAVFVLAVLGAICFDNTALRWICGGVALGQVAIVVFFYEQLKDFTM